MTRLTSLLLCFVLLLAAGLAWAKPSPKKPPTEEPKKEEEEKKPLAEKEEAAPKKSADDEPKKEKEKEKEDEAKKEEAKKEEPKKPLTGKEAAEDEQPSITATIPCAACHTTAGWKTTGSGEGVAFDHSKTGFPLTGDHVKTACVGCHNGKPVKRACSSCHNDAHRARLGMVCERCHTPSGWRNTRSLDMHRLTRFPLTGMHVLRDCSECHRRASEHQWTGVPIDCFACHEKDYRRTDLRPVHNGSVAGQNAFPRDCSICHRSISWAPARFDALLISESSAIPLKTQAPATHDVKFPIRFGVHRTAICEDCHTNPATPRAIRCTGCHAHEPVRLTAQHKGMVSPLGTACLSCHPGGVRR